MSMSNGVASWDRPLSVGAREAVWKFFQSCCVFMVWGLGGLTHNLPYSSSSSAMNP